MLHVRVEDELKARANKTLHKMGLDLSTYIRMSIVRMIEEKAIPFHVRVPNAETVAAMKELERGEGKSFSSVSALMADLNAED
jgi:DNA-damage-inducible protein J